MQVEGLPLKFKFQGKLLPALENLPDKLTVKLGLFRNALENPIFQKQLGLVDYWNLTQFIPASSGECLSRGIFTSKSQLWQAIKLFVGLHFINETKVSLKKVLYDRAGEVIFIERDGSLVEGYSRWYLDLRLQEIHEGKPATRVPDLYHLLNQMDTVQIMEEEFGIQPSNLFYDFGNVEGNRVVGLSYAGTSHLKAESAKGGNPLSVIKSEVMPITDGFRGVVQITDRMNRVKWGSSDESMVHFPISVEYDGREIDFIEMLRTLKDPIL